MPVMIAFPAGYRREAVVSDAHPQATTIPQDRWPLSYEQRRMWFLEHLQDSRSAYSGGAAWLLTGAIADERIASGLLRVLVRHDALFMAFTDQDGTPMQTRVPSGDFSVSCVDLTGADDPEREARQRIAAATGTPFDLTSGRLIAATVYRINRTQAIVGLVFHHIALDGHSLELIEREFRIACGDPDATLPEARARYLDHVERQQARAAEAGFAGKVDRCVKRLRGAPTTLSLITDKVRGGEFGSAGQTLRTPIDPELAAAVTELARQLRVTTYVLLLATFQVLMSAESGADEVLVGSPVTTRTTAMADVVGLFVNTIVARSDISTNPTFAEHVQRTRADVIDAISTAEVPFELVVSALEPRRAVSRNPVVQAEFSLYNSALPLPDRADFSLERDLVPPPGAKFDLTWYIYQGDDDLRLEVEYSTSLFEQETIRRFIGHWLTMLAAVVADPHARVRDLDLMPAAEREAVLSFGRLTGAEPAAVRIDQQVSRQAAATPDAIAITGDSTALTYRQLDTAASRLARHLLTAGITPRDIVAVCATRTPDTIITLLAILRTGAAYLPLDPAHPADRLAYLLADSRAAHVITFPGTAASVPPGPWQAIPVTSAATGFARYPATPPPAAISPADTAYVIYTSGSTGRPKGVAVTHASITATLAAVQDRFRFGPADTWTLFHSAGFDYSVWEMWGPLTTGGRLVVIPHWQSRTPEAFYRLVAAEHVTVLTQTPSAFTEFDRADTASPEPLALRWIILAGEPLQPPAIRRWTTRHGWGADEAAPGRHRGPRLANMYGITEATIHTTFICLDEGCLDQPLTVVGGPLGHASAQIVDGAGGLCPVGVVGEIYVGAPAWPGGTCTSRA